MGFKKALAVNLSRLFKDHIYTSVTGWRRACEGRWTGFPAVVYPRSTEMFKEEVFIEALDLSGKLFTTLVVIRIYTLFFARKVGEKGKVITFEPNPVSKDHIVTNIELNGFKHVDIFNVALGEKPGKLTFAFPAKDPGRGSADALIREQILKEPGSKTTEVDVDALDSLISSAGLPKPDFAKIDVEGLELKVLRGMPSTLQSHRPQLFIEIHGADLDAKQKNIREVATFLLDLNYKIHHVESNQEITYSNMDEAREGHIYCT